MTKNTVLVLGVMFFLTAQAQTAAEQEPLQLEATIRANKEQPKVISIVPWQLPRHRKIAGALEWQQFDSQPQLLERSQFLRRIQLQKRLGNTAVKSGREE